MLAQVFSAAVQGIDAHPIEIEVDSNFGATFLVIVGLPDAAVKESRDRVLTAMTNSGFRFPMGRTTINLAPADVKKEGPSFDLPIALGILAATEQMVTDQLDNFAIIGELALTGAVRSCRGILPVALQARAAGKTGILVPVENAAEAAVVEGLQVIPIPNLRAAAQFLRSGSAYLQLRSILNGYESETVSTVAEISKKITSTEINLGYQQIRVKNLEDLHKRFPGSSNASQQVVDPKDSGAKYLPLTTQIIAANSDINQSKEDLIRLRDRLAQIEIIKNYLEAVNPLVEQNPNGLVLVSELLHIEKGLQSKVGKDDARQQEVLDQLHAQLSQIKARFTIGLEANMAPTSKKTGMIKATAGGLAAAFFLMLLLLLGQRVWTHVKSGGVSNA